MKQKQKVVFLDRDGVINKDSPDYIKSWDEFEFIEKSIDAIKCLTENYFKIIIITNQSAINRKFISKEDLINIHTNMKKMVESNGGKIEDIFFCPHHPDEGCLCRKPLPGLIHMAQKKYNIDLKNSFMIGDSRKDIECAKNAKCAFTILVKTGNGIKAQDELIKKNIKPNYVAKNLYGAVDWIIGKM